MTGIDFRTYRSLVLALPFGKKLPTAIYVYRDTDACRRGVLGEIVAFLAAKHGIDRTFNVVKFRTDVFRLSLLAYPMLEEVAHPVLAAAVAVDLTSGKGVRTDYDGNLNPPILHRKELLLPPDHPRRAEYSSLSVAESAHGLYQDTAVIGFKANWERLLREKGLSITGHHLEAAHAPAELHEERPTVEVHRHRTALTRYSFSKPVRTLLEYGQLSSTTSFFDYGCGLGGDVRGLREFGYEATGWDPVHQPNAERRGAEVVNLGYVLNVIEDPAERLATLVDAWGLAQRLLVVSTLMRGRGVQSEGYRDGVLTRRGTFQKVFEQRELQQYLEDVLDRVAVPVALGMFYVFRQACDQQEFLARRSRRTVDCDSVLLAFGRPQPKERRARTPREDVHATHRELLEAFWERCVELGRLPQASEFERSGEICAAFGSEKRALAGLLRRGRASAFDSVRAARRNDLLVYLAIANLRRMPSFSQFPDGVRQDIKVFFGSYGRGLDEGVTLLRSAADPDTIRLACDDTSIGWQDEEALYVHGAVRDQLPPVLRCYLACAELLFGDARDVDLIKLHKLSGKVTFFEYDDFESSLLPELRVRKKVNLRTQQVEVFDHTGRGDLLYYKERFLSAAAPQEDGSLAETVGEFRFG